MKNYFSYSAGTGFEKHGTIDAAREFAEREIEHYRDSAFDDGWPEETSTVRYGVILQEAFEVIGEKKEGTDHDYFSEYEMRDTPEAERIKRLVGMVSDYRDIIEECRIPVLQAHADARGMENIEEMEMIAALLRKMEKALSET